MNMLTSMSSKMFDCISILNEILMCFKPEKSQNMNYEYNCSKISFKNSINQSTFAFCYISHSFYFSKKITYKQLYTIHFHFNQQLKFLWNCTILELNFPFHLIFMKLSNRIFFLKKITTKKK